MEDERRRKSAESGTWAEVEVEVEVASNRMWRGKFASLKHVTYPVRRPMERSAMKVDSVSPERCEVMTPQPLDCESWTA